MSRRRREALGRMERSGSRRPSRIYQQLGGSDPVDHAFLPYRSIGRAVILQAYGDLTVPVSVEDRQTARSFLATGGGGWSVVAGLDPRLVAALVVKRRHIPRRTMGAG